MVEAGSVVPPLELPEVAGKLVALYGLRGELRRLDGYEDQNFEVRASSGHYVLRVSHPRTPPSTVAFQNAAMAAAGAAFEGEGAVPQVVTSLGGREIERWPGEVQRACRLLTWVEGSLWATRRPVGLEAHRSLGAFLGRLDRGLAQLEAARSSEDFEWDLRRADQVIRERVHHLAWPRERALVGRHLGAFEAKVRPAAARLPEALIHNDANDYNLLLGEDGRVRGIIDFGDACRTWRVAELAIAIAYAMQGEFDPLPRVTALVSAYLEVHPLEALELELLPVLVAARLCTTVTMAAQKRSDAPEAAYHQVSAAPAWRALEQLEAAGPEALAEAVAIAAGRVPPEMPATRETETREGLLKRRRARLGPSLSLSYAEPLHIVRGRGAHLFDAQGRAFLDAVNNVCHVGHAHPQVVRAASEQMERLNTNTRYLHEEIVAYAEALTATLPAPLEVCFFVCSGSEANDLAVRMARTVTGRRAVYVLDHAYHGNTQSLIELSPYKFAGRGGSGPGPDTRVLAMPDPVRDPRRGPGQVEAHAAAFGAALEAEAEDPALFMAESMLGCGGQVELPGGYLEAMYARARAAGALCLADEVQVGFGRVGTHFWGFETQGVVPDIVTMGKPIGNGHPLAAVVTTREVAEAFANGMEYFNTFGGNPVSAAVGRAVLDIIEVEGLQARAASVGGELREALGGLTAEDPRVGQVRGLGLFLGVELVRGEGDARPDAVSARAVVEFARRQGVLLSTDGPFDNVIKIKPPLVFGREDAQRLVAAVRGGLAVSRRR